MSKTFKSALDSLATLEVEEETYGPGVYLTVSQSTILLAQSAAPALALAILEAAGYKEEQGNETTEAAHRFGMAMLHLRLGIKEQEYITAEAKEQAELEAEALELLNSGLGATFKSWPEAVRTNQPSVPNWLAVARKAREIGAEK